MEIAAVGFWFLNSALYISLVYSSGMYIVGRQTLSENHLTVVNLLLFLMLCISKVHVIYLEEGLIKWKLTRQLLCD